MNEIVNDIKIIEVFKSEKEVKIIVENSVAFQGGGGQERDFVKLKSKNCEIDVSKISKRDDLVSFTIDLSENPEFEFLENSVISEVIDGSRREILSKSHSAEHLFMGFVAKFAKARKFELKLEKTEITTGSAKIFVICDVEKEDFLKLIVDAEKEANKIIQEKKEVFEHLFSIDEIDDLNDKFPELRLKKEKIKDKIVRVIEIDGVDYSACCGTHINNTNELDLICVDRINSYKNKGYIVNFTILVQDSLDLKNKLLDFLLTRDLYFEDFEKNYDKVVNERDKFKSLFGKISHLVWHNKKVFEFEGKEFSFLKLSGFESKKLFDLLADKEDYLVVNEVNEDKFQILGEGIDLSFVENFKGRLAQRSILTVDGVELEKVENKLFGKKEEFMF